MSQAEPQLPLFYKQPEALQPDRHAGLSLLPTVNYGFAADAVSVPISAAEAPLVARHYPIVFASTGENLPLAVLSLKRDENLFVDAEGGWEEGVHIPAYLRRYPFVFATGTDEGRLTLCIDRASERVRIDGGNKLFEDGKPSKTTESALQFCASFEREIAQTRLITAALKAQGLLVRNEATISLPSGSRIEMRDFLVPDADRIDALADEAFLELRRLGALPLIFAHFASRASWHDLMRRLEQRSAVVRQ